MTTLFEPLAQPRMARAEGFAPAHARALDTAAETWGAARTWLLPQGGTQPALAACLALRAARGRQVVVQRDAGPGVLSGLIAAGLSPYWVAPEVDASAGVAHCVTPAALEAALTEAPGARAAIVVAPTFHGAVPDTAALAAVAHRHGAALVVDETLGAHLPFHPLLPQHAIAAGADLALTGSSLLHHGPRAERRLPAAAIERAVDLCHPGAPAPAALGAIRARAIDGERLLEATLRAAAAARSELTGVPGLRVLWPDSAGVAGLDPLRLTVDVRESRRDARAVAAALRERAGIELELATDRLLVAGLRLGDDQGLAGRFAAALLDVLWTIPAVEPPALAPLPLRPGPALCSPRAAWLAPQERVPAAAAIGRIAAETLTPYPSGVPAVLPGERLEADVVSGLLAVAAAGGVVGGSADGLATFGVIAGAQGRPRRFER